MSTVSTIFDGIYYQSRFEFFKKKNPLYNKQSGFTPHRLTKSLKQSRNRLKTSMTNSADRGFLNPGPGFRNPEARVENIENIEVGPTFLGLSHFELSGPKKRGTH